MTVARLHKELGKLVAQGLGRNYVCVNKPTFVDPLEGDGLAFHFIYHSTVHVGEVLDDDGGLATRADGTMRIRTTVILSGGLFDPGAAS